MRLRSARLRLAAYRGLRLPFILSPLLDLSLLVSFLFIGRLGHRELFSSHEARAAQNAQRMLDTGEWGLPVLFDGQADLQKPPGYYWMVAACGWLNGGEVNAFVARLPAALAGLAAVLLVYLYLRREGRPTAALIAALALATAVHFTAISRTARIDVPLTCAVTAALLAFHRGCCHREGEALAESQPRRRLGWSLALPRSGRLGWHLLSAVAAAVGVMLKGPVALALVGPVAVVWLVTERKPRYGRGGAFPSLPLSSALLGTFLLLALALPWFVWANQTTGGEFARVFFWHHNVERFTGASQTLASYPWWYYVPRFAVDFLPWTPPLVLLAVWTGRSGQCNEDRLFRFGVVWFAVMFVVLSAARFKRSDYLLPLFPGAAITLGCAGEAWLASRTDPRTVRRAWWGFGVVIALVVVGWQVMTFAVEPAEQAKEEKRAFAAMIRQHAPPPNEVLLFRTESHLLAFHLGRPLYTLVEWMDLNDRLAEPGPHFVVMPPEYVYPAHQIVTSRRLVVVARLEDYTTDTPPRPLVFLRTAD